MYSGARLIRMANERKNHPNYPSMWIIQAYFTLSNITLCLRQLSGRCKLARVKLSGLYSSVKETETALNPVKELVAGPWLAGQKVFIK